MGDYPGTPSSSVYQVTQCTAFQAAERNVQHLSYEEVNHITRTPPALRCLEGNHITRTQYTLWCLEGNHITSTPPALRCLEGTTMSNRGQRPWIQIAHYLTSAWQAVRRRTGSFFPVYRLGEDGDLLEGRWWLGFWFGR